MRHLYRFAWVMLMLVAGAPAGAQQLILSFPNTSCESSSCDRINVDRGGGFHVDSWTFRDGLSFRLDSSATIADTVDPGQPLVVPVCFAPNRRGQITDSLTIVISRQGAPDTIRVRLTGMGIGPELIAEPTALNFPRTNPGGTGQLSVRLINVGELPLVFTAASINIPPPFRVITPLPITINPGDTVSIDIIFEPTEKGIFSSEAIIRAGCSLQYRLTLNGATDLVGTGAVLRISKLGFDPVNHEEIPCDVSRCTQVTFANAGNARLWIENVRWSIDTVGYRITPALVLPMLIEPGQNNVFDVCLDSRSVGSLRDTLVVTSNSRTPIAVGMVMDCSRSMSFALRCGATTTTRLSQAVVQGQSFISRTLLYLPALGIQDKLTIMRYSDLTRISTIFPLQLITDASRAAAETALTTLTPVGGTFTGTALLRMMDTLARSGLQNRVIVLLSDGAATDTAVVRPAQIIAAARARNVRIFTIGIGSDQDPNAAPYLLALSNGTNGVYFDANDCDSLQAAFESITDLMSRGTITRDPFSMKVTAPYIIASGDMRFDSTYFEDSSCKTITLTNVGEGAAVVDSVYLRDALGLATDEFYFGQSMVFPLRIPESGQITIEICFRPRHLRQREGRAMLTYNSCAPHLVVQPLRGAGWARAGLRIDDRRLGLPGSAVSLPVYLDTSLARYEVTTVRFRLRWNKTMLDLRGVRPTPAVAGVSLASPVVYSGRYAEAEFVATGSFLDGPAPIADIDFMVLRGDTLGSLVELDAAIFEDDNPKALMKNAGLVAFDSTCFRDGKEIQAGGAAGKLVAAEVRPTPARRSEPLRVALQSDAATRLRVSFYGTDGKPLGAPLERHIEAGSSELLVDISTFPAGTAFIVLEDDFGQTLVRSVAIVE